MTSQIPIRPTLLIRPSRACPRCNRGRLRPMGINAFDAFAWHECEDCLHLWAVPRGWSPERGSALSRAEE